MRKSIKCPYCGYDGGDLKIGRRLPNIDFLGTPKLTCLKCKREFIINLTSA